MVPAVNQVELHPYLQQAEVRRTSAELGVLTEAWSPIAKGGALLADPVVTGLAEKHGVTPAQVVLRWHLQLGTVVIPKSVTPERISRQHRPVRLRARRAGPGGGRGPGPRGPHRAGPGPGGLTHGFGPAAAG